MNVLSNPFHGDLIGPDGHSVFEPGLHGGPPLPGFVVCDRCLGFACENEASTLLRLPPPCKKCDGCGQLPRPEC